MNKKFFFQWHKRLAVLMAIPVLMWTLSGLLHPMMANWLKPSIAKRVIAPQPIKLDQAILPPAKALASHPELHQFKLINIAGKWVYLAITPDQQQYFHLADTGELLKNGAERYAEQLARAYLDDKESKLLSIEKITDFNGTYGYINRLLPVYRVELDRTDKIQAVVDCRTGKLASYDSPSKRLFSQLFDWMHRWTFLGDRNNYLRISVILTASILSLLVAFSGVINLFLFKVKRKKTDKDGTVQTVKRKLTLRRRMHRSLGFVCMVFYFMFGLSGVYHIASKYAPDDSPLWVSSQKINPSLLTSNLEQVLSTTNKPVSQISLAVIEDIPFYRLALMDRKKKGSSILIKAKTGDLASKTDEDYAKNLALEFSDYQVNQIKKTEQIKKFRNDYGFIFKRLPVWRVHFNNQEYWHYTVDTSDAHMAMRTSPASLIEALSFVYLHKFHFLDPINKNLRDYVTAIGVLLIALVCLLGISLVLKKTST